MRKEEFSNEVIITAERGMYLTLDKKGIEKTIGKPERIILSKQGVIPEFVEKPLTDIGSEE